MDLKNQTQRDIKFRAWDNSVKAMFDMVVLTSYSDGSLGIEIGDNYSSLRTHKDVILMQYTGLKDKNGVEIFDGDICQAFSKLYTHPTPNIIKVIYNTDIAQFQPVQWWASQNKYLPLSSNFENYEFEIIGNIHENPELI